MSELQLNLSSTESLRRFTDLVRAVCELHGGVTAPLREFLSAKGLEIGVHQDDIDCILGSLAVQAQQQASHDGSVQSESSRQSVVTRQAATIIQPLVKTNIYVKRLNKYVNLQKDNNLPPGITEEIEFCFENIHNVPIINKIVISDEGHYRQPITRVGYRYNSKYHYFLNSIEESLEFIVRMQPGTLVFLDTSYTWAKSPFLPGVQIDYYDDEVSQPFIVDYTQSTPYLLVRDIMPSGGAYRTVT